MAAAWSLLRDAGASERFAIRSFSDGRMVKHSKTRCVLKCLDMKHVDAMSVHVRTRDTLIDVDVIEPLTSVYTISESKIR